MDCAMHPGRTVMRGWSEEEAELADVTETERRFFVRIKASALADVQAAFAGSSLVEAGGGEDSGLFVPAMKEKEFDAKCAALGDAILNRIRVA